MNIKSIIFTLFCIIFIVSCAERKVYLPDTKQQKEIPQKEEKVAVEEKKPPDKYAEETAQLETKQLIKRLQDEIGDIYFDFDKYDIRQDAIPTLKKVASSLQRYQRLRVIIEGHCDERGTNEYNFALGQKRANAARQYLVSLGISSSRIDIISYGEEKPLCTEKNEACWQKNRRAHFVFIEEGK